MLRNITTISFIQFKLTAIPDIAAGETWSENRLRQRTGIRRHSVKATNTTSMSKITVKQRKI